MTKTFEPGQTVYLPDGREAKYVVRYGSSHIVLEVRQGFDPEEGYFTYHDDAVPVRTLFAEKPTEAEQRTAKIEKLRAELAEMEGEA